MRITLRSSRGSRWGVIVIVIVVVLLSFTTFALQLGVSTEGILLLLGGVVAGATRLLRYLPRPQKGEL